MIALRRVRKDRIAPVAFGDDVLAQAKRVRDHRGHRLDRRGIDLAELLDPAEDVVELGHEPLGGGIVDRDAREARDLLHGCSIYGHGARLAAAPPPFNAYSNGSATGTPPAKAWPRGTVPRAQCRSIAVA